MPDAEKWPTVQNPEPQSCTFRNMARMHLSTVAASVGICILSFRYSTFAPETHATFAQKFYFRNHARIVQYCTEYCTLSAVTVVGQGPVAHRRAAPIDVRKRSLDLAPAGWQIGNTMCRVRSFRTQLSGRHGLLLVL